MQNTILIIDDQLTARKMLEHYLGHFYNVVAEGKAEDALTYLKEGNKPKVIILDIIMDGMSGIQFLERLQDMYEALPPIIMLTNVNNSQERIKCLELGIFGYMVKPCDPKELKVKIDKIIASEPEYFLKSK
ncbi:MAG: response regulator [Bacteroidota bacterium]